MTGLGRILLGPLVFRDVLDILLQLPLLGDGGHHLVLGVPGSEDLP